MVTTELVQRWNAERKDFVKTVWVTPDLNQWGQTAQVILQVAGAAGAGKQELWAHEAKQLAQELLKAAARAEAMLRAYQSPSIFRTQASRKPLRKGRKTA